jgi:WD40 repeat protein
LKYLNLLFSIYFKYLVASGSKDDTAKVWNYTSGQAIRTFTPGADIRSVKSINATILACAPNDRKIYLYDINSGIILSTLTGHAGDVKSMVLSRKGSLLISGSWDNTIGVWSMINYTLIRMISIPENKDPVVDYFNDDTIVYFPNTFTTFSFLDINTGIRISTYNHDGKTVLAILSLRNSKL